MISSSHIFGKTIAVCCLYFCLSSYLQYKNCILYSIKIISLIINGFGFYLIYKSLPHSKIINSFLFSLPISLVSVFTHTCSPIWDLFCCKTRNFRQSASALSVHACQVQLNFFHISAYFPCLFILAIRLSYFISFIKLLPQKFIYSIFSVHMVFTLTLIFIN